MKHISLQMMTTLNGRLDKPFEWMGEITNDHYEKIDQLYARYDSILVGRTTYEEMASYWPGALSGAEGSAVNRRMAQRMRDCRKLVISSSNDHEISDWVNVERIAAPTDVELGSCLSALKRQSASMIHLSGGSELARSIIRLGMVDEFNLFVVPTVSAGPAWFENFPDATSLTLVDSQKFQNGVVWVQYSAQNRVEKEVPSNFSELLTSQSDDNRPKM